METLRVVGVTRVAAVMAAYNPGSWAVYSRRWAGRLWPLYWASPYVRRGVRLAREHLLARRAAASSS